MRKWLISTVLLTLLSITTQVMADTNIAVVDIKAVVASSSQVQALKKEQQLKLQELNKWLQMVKADVSKQKTKEEKEKLVKKYDAEFIKKQKVINDEYSRKLQAIDTNITKAIATEAKLKGYNVVLSKQGAVLYCSNDLTENIKKAVK